MTERLHSGDMELESGERYWGRLWRCPRIIKELMAKLGPYFPYSGKFLVNSPKYIQKTEIGGILHPNLILECIPLEKILWSTQ